MAMVEVKMLSSLEKCFYNDLLEQKPEKTRFVMFKNERLSFQVAYRACDPNYNMQRWCRVKLGGDLAPYARARLVGNVLNMYPTFNDGGDGEFLKKEPGAYPDLLRPFAYPEAVSLPHNQTHAIWVDIELPEGFAAGKYSISLSVFGQDSEEKYATATGEVTVVDALLPPQKLIHTEWFYTDCIANYYHVKPFSKQHWKYIESFMRTAAKNGVNMVLTPVFTPELDTYVGGERLTTQLVDIALTGKNRYAFSFEELHKWIDLALSCGIQYFEIAHLFSQWGSKATPKIIVKVNGRSKKYFGWHTDATGEEYKAFLAQFLPAVLGEFKKRGLKDKVFFHVSDEPSLATLPQYKKCKEMVEPYIDGCPIIDALSNFEFYEQGILKKPVPGTRNAMPFVKAGVQGLWVYYCGGGKAGVADRSISMPTARTRVLGVQLYKYNIEGFLHWGYNFYNACRSYSTLDPYGYADGSFFTPAGDCFLVYPGTDGTAWESIRLNALREAIDDMRALDLYEQTFGREAALALIGDIDFTHYPTNPDYLLGIREKIATDIQNKK